MKDFSVSFGFQNFCSVARPLHCREITLSLFALLIASPPTKRAFFCQWTNSQLGFMIETKIFTVFNFCTAGPKQLVMRQLRSIDCANQKELA
jgi:hypothetical protein